MAQPTDPHPEEPQTMSAAARLAQALADASSVAAPGSNDDAIAAPDSGADSDRASGSDSVSEADSASDSDSVSGADTGSIGDPDGVVADPPSGDGRRASSTRLLLAVMAVLVLCLPVVAYVGYRTISTSTRGEVLSGKSNPSDPGYEALVEPTPVALVIRTDNNGTAEALTALSLNGPGNAGGALVSIPVATRLRNPGFGAVVFEQVATLLPPKQSGPVIGAELGFGFTDVIKMDDATLVSFLGPAGTLEVNNPSEITADDGRVFPAGPLKLDAEGVVAYLSVKDGSSELERIGREQLVWTAWIDAIRSSKSRDGIVPGETTTGLGRYLRGLAAGEVTTATVPVRPYDQIDGVDTYKLDVPLLHLMMTNAVPYPVGSSDGARLTVRIVNGTGPEPIPPSVMQRVVFANGQINVIGNASTFGSRLTTLTYADSAQAKRVKAMAKILGHGQVIYVANADQTTDVIIVIGSDLQNNPPPLLTPSEVEP